MSSKNRRYSKPSKFDSKPHKINVLFEADVYETIHNMAMSEHTSHSEIVRRLTNIGIQSQYSMSNIDVLAPIIREQIDSVLAPYFNRLASLSAKTCSQSRSAFLLNAEALLKVLPDSDAPKIQEAYEKARKNGIEYMKTNIKDL